MTDQSKENQFTMEVDSDFLRNVLDSIRDSIKIVDRQFNVIYANKAQLEAGGTERIKGAHNKVKCFDVFYDNPEQCSYCLIEHVLNTGTPAFNVFQSQVQDEASLKEISVFPLTGESGEVEHVIEIVRDVAKLQKDLAARREFSEIISQDAKMEEVFDVIRSVAAANATVLIYGETGTGKELVARAIHRSSNRADQRMVTINCGAVPETLLETELFGHEKGSFTGADQRRIGKFELAHKGTLFLDEIGTISPAMQVKILRALQEGEITRVGGSDPIQVKVRFICATNIDLEEAVRNGAFREDLFYRINVVPIHLPPLRERGGDVILLANHYLEKFSVEIGKTLRGFSREAIEQLRTYHWPGNIRELRNLVERAVILSKRQQIDRLDISERSRKQEDPLRSGVTFKDVVEAAEKEYIIAQLRANRGNINKTAESAGVNARTVHRKMKEFGITKEFFK